MVTLVRCWDKTFALALESRINQLGDEGLITAFLCNGIWIQVKAEKKRASVPEHRPARMSATVSMR